MPRSLKKEPATESDPGPVRTMADLAERLGVSAITVSRALRDSPSVTPETRARIQAAAQELGYRFNHSARNLRLRRTHTIAVVVEMQPNADRPISDPYPLQLLGGIAQELTTRGLSMLLAPLERVAAGDVAADGVILLGQGLDGSAVAAIDRSGLPAVVWGAGIDGRVVVGSDNVHGGKQAAEHLLHLQRRDWCFVGDTRHGEVKERWLGFSRHAKRASAKVVQLNPAAFTFGAGFTVMQAHLARPGVKPPDGVFAASDLIAMGALRALLDAGLRVPDDVSVIGFDDSPSAATFAPPLSSVRQDWRHGGVLLASKLLDLIEGRPAGSEIMPTELIERAT
jgi:DNA-binding LacI/PurR family transcriptional regulator